MNREDNPERFDTTQRIGRQFASVPWWAKPILFLVYVVVFAVAFFLIRYLAAAGAADNPIGKLVSYLLGH